MRFQLTLFLSGHTTNLLQLHRSTRLKMWVLIVAGRKESLLVRLIHTQPEGAKTSRVLARRAKIKNQFLVPFIYANVSISAVASLYHKLTMRSHAVPISGLELDWAPWSFTDGCADLVVRRKQQATLAAWPCWRPSGSVFVCVYPSDCVYSKQYDSHSIAPMLWKCFPD